MAMRESVVVEQVDSKEVVTKFGKKPTFSFKANGEWFKTGFKRHGLNVGDVVSFDYKEGSYGKDVEASAIAKSGTGLVPTAALPGAQRPSTPPVSSRHGGFPIPALDGQRSIVRQNALTNARELVVASIGVVKSALSMSDVGEMRDAILTLASQFEAYTAGDADAEYAEAEADMKANAAEQE